MKKILAVLMGIFLFAFTANARQITDVPSNYWAHKEIHSVVADGIMTVSADGKFNPEAAVSRVSFADMVLKALENDRFQITITNKFTDVDSNTPKFDSIMRSEQLGLVYGYPDKTFRPDRIMTKAEANSVMSHITKDTVSDASLLNGFVDKGNIPAWALKTYEKTVKYGLYVNYPDAKEFLPAKELNRAEAAVLLYKLRNALNLVKDQYKLKETILKTEHLSVVANAPNNTVQITNIRKIIDVNNVIKVAFTTHFNSKNYNEGDNVYFVLKQDLVTDEGTLLFPAGTEFTAMVDKLDDPQWLNKNAKLTLDFKEAKTPCGEKFIIKGKVFVNDGVLESNCWQKPLWWTLGGAAVGTGAGLGIGIPNDETGKGLAIGIPCGAAAGAVAGFVTPGVNYGAKEGHEIPVLITCPVSIYNK
ncbi:MAG: S-layer homology domain-containing protein [Candidatus Gastranaerophilales bacterium]|nr:S-layer homology domain-containing protein [Candidatus Gastranaerophilales bacterium]